MLLGKEGSRVEGVDNLENGNVTSSNRTCRETMSLLWTKSRHK